MVTSRHLSDDATLAPAMPALPIARNTALLSAALAANSVMLQLYAAVASITLVLVLDVKLLLGLGPAIVLTAGALAAVPAGRLMDRFGRGRGWNLSFVAATAELADRTGPSERGRLLGLNDLLSSATGAGLTLLGGFVLTAAGVSALAIAAMALLVAPALWILRAGAASPRVPMPATST
jgi:hypothetical protein